MKLLICGKGGSGKSTVAALLAAAVSKQGKQVLVVDADESNIGLFRMLGMEMPEPLMDHLGGKKGFRQRTAAAGNMLGGPSPLFPDRMTAEELPDACVAGNGGVRALSVGKIHHFGEGCACPMGQLFRLLFESLDLSGQDLVIVDTAAGVEHFGRRLQGQVDQVLCVVDPSFESVHMAERVSALASEAGLPVSVVLNKVTDDLEADMVGALGRIRVIGRVPDNRAVFMANFKGDALETDMPAMDSVCNAILG